MRHVDGWEKYLVIENLFCEAKQFVDIKEENFDVTSMFFSNQVILLGAEIEAAFKKICSLNGVSGGNMSQYKEETLKLFPNIAKYGCDLLLTDYEVLPFDDWKDEGGKLDWWDVYINVKHSTVDNCATLKIAIGMLSALEILLLLIEAKAHNDLGSDGFISATLFQNEIPNLLLPKFRRRASLKSVGVTTSFLLPQEDVK